MYDLSIAASAQVAGSWVITPASSLMPKRSYVGSGSMARSPSGTARSSPPPPVVPPVLLGLRAFELQPARSANTHSHFMVPPEAEDIATARSRKGLRALRCGGGRRGASPAGRGAHECPHLSRPPAPA